MGQGRWWQSPPPEPSPEPQEARAEPPGVSLERLNELLRPTYEEYGRLKEESDLMMQYRAETVKTLNTVAGELKSKHFELNLDKLIWSSAGLAVTLICGVGLASLLLTTAGVGALLACVCVCGAVLAMGTTASIRPYFCEKMLESERLAEVKETVMKDRDQCVKVLNMLNEFKSYPQADMVDDPFVKCCIKRFRVVVEADVAAKKYIVQKVGESVNNYNEELNGSKETENAKWRLKIFLGAVTAVFSTISLAMLSNALSYIVSNADFVVLVVAYILIAAFGLGNIFVLVLHFYEDPHSKVAKEIHEKSSELEQHTAKWKSDLSKKPLCNPSD